MENSGQISFDGDDLLREFIGKKGVGDLVNFNIETKLKDIGSEGFSFSIESASSDEYEYEVVSDETIPEGGGDILGDMLA
jgi:hypothetical protein